MAFEAKFRNPAMKAVGIGIGALAVGLPLRDRKNSRRIIGAALGRKVDCGSCIEAENPAYAFDAIVVPGGGLIRTEDGIWLPSVYGQWRLEAAVLAFRDREAPRIILLDGKAGPEQNQFANLKFLKAMAGQRGIGLPDDAIIAEDQQSTNTRTNMERLAEIAEKYGLKKFTIKTNQFHETRATLFACGSGVFASSSSAEETLIAEDPSRKAYIEAVYASREMRMHKVKELVEVGTQLWDPNGRVQTLARNVMTRVRGWRTYEVAQPKIDVVVLQETPSPESMLSSV